MCGSVGGCKGSLRYQDLSDVPSASRQNVWLQDCVHVDASSVPVATSGQSANVLRGKTLFCFPAEPQCGLWHLMVLRQPSEPYWISRSKVKVTWVFVCFLRAWYCLNQLAWIHEISFAGWHHFVAVCRNNWGYRWAVLSLEQGLAILFVLHFHSIQFCSKFLSSPFSLYGQTWLCWVSEKNVLFMFMITQSDVV